MRATCVTPGAARRLNVLTRCDCTTQLSKAAELARRMDDLEVRIADTRRGRGASPRSAQSLDGNEVMELLGVGPGRIVGKALDFLLEIRLDEGMIGRDGGDRPAARLARRAVADRWGGHRSADGTCGARSNIRIDQSRASALEPDEMPTVGCECRRDLRRVLEHSVGRSRFAAGSAGTVDPCALT